MGLFYKIFKEKQDLKDQITQLENINGHLNSQNERYLGQICEKDKYIDQILKSLSECQEKLSECQMNLEEEKTNNILQNHENLKHRQIIEIQEQKISKYIEDLAKTNKDLDKSREMIKNLNHELYNIKNLYKNKKDIREYGKNKTERN